MPQPLRIGLMGYGNAARVYHLPYILANPNYIIHAFYQRSAKPEEGKPHCTIDYPDVKHYSNVDDFLADSEIELVCVLTQYDTHASFAEKALLAGKHVVVEKPVSRDHQEFQKAIDASQSSGNLLIPFQSRRYDSDMQTLQKLLQDDVMGEITDAEIHYDLDLPSWMAGMTDPGWKPGEGMNFGIGCHSLDQALHLFGKPKSVTAFYRSLRGVKSETEDTFHMILQYSDKPLIVHVKTHVVTKMRHALKYYIRGNKGTFIKFGDDQQEHQIMSGMKPGDKGFGEEPEEIWGELQTVDKVLESQEKKDEYWIGKVKPENKGIWQYYEDVYRTVRAESDQVIKAETSLWGIRVIELARESATKGVTVPFDL